MKNVNWGFIGCGEVTEKNPDRLSTRFRGLMSLP